jgi:hypothetical protein
MEKQKKAAENEQDARQAARIAMKILEKKREIRALYL